MKNSKIKIFSVFMYVMMIICIFLPWFEVEGTRHNVFGVYSYAKTIDGFNMDIFNMEIIALILYMVISVLYMLTVFMNKKWNLNIVCIVVALIHSEFFYEGLMFATGSGMVTFYVKMLFLMNVVEFVIPKMLNSMQESKEEARESVYRDKTFKEEKKKRLQFKGRYTKLFYQMIWKNFVYYWRDYVLFIICGVTIATFSLVGFGSYEMMTKVHSKEALVIQTGLGGVLIDALFPIAICATILMVYVLIFYTKKRFLSYSMFFQLGSRKKTVYSMLAIEVVLSLLISLGVGCLLGNAVILLLKNGIAGLVGEAVLLSTVTWKTYVKVLGVVTGIYLISLTATRDIALDLNIVSASARNVQGDRLPRKGLVPLSIMGIIIMSVFSFSYSSMINFEDIKLLLLYFIGVFLVLRFGIAMYLNKAKKRWEISEAADEPEPVIL